MATNSCFNLLLISDGVQLFQFLFSESHYYSQLRAVQDAGIVKVRIGLNYVLNFVLR